MYRNIVVAYDGSDGARAALKSAIALADSSGGAVHLIHSTGHLEYAQKGVVEEDSSAESSAKNLLEEAAEQVEEVEVVTSVVHGNPIDGITGAAEALHADLIISGSRGRALMPEAVLGRVTSGIVSKAPCDVLVVQPQP